MKILIVGFAKIKYMLYPNFYLENIDRNEHDVHFAYWNRDLKEEDMSSYPDITFHEFRRHQEDNVSPKYKVVSFFKYRRYITDIVKKHDFDFVIVLHTMAGVLMRDIWTKKFCNRFIFDYRDSTYERYSIFRKMIADLIKYSKATFTSSDGFRVFFPRDYGQKVYTTHNILMESLQHRSLERVPCNKIRVSFWGLIREETINRQIISQIAKDPRFELHFYGREQATARKLKEYAKEIQAENVFFHGEYVPAQRYEFAANTDLIHNIYRNANMMLAVSNKYYDSGLFYIPQLCMRDSFMAKMAEGNGVGFACDPWAEDFTETIYQYYTKQDKTAFGAACDRDIERIVDEYKKAVGMIHSCIQEDG